MSLIAVYRNRGITKNIVMQTGLGTTITAGDSDKIRFVIGREGSLDAAPLFSVSSDADSVAGSFFHKNTPSSGINQLRLDATDLADIPSGVYTASVELLDSQDGSEWKEVSRQVISIYDN
jgi:hypothetical protein